MNLIMNAESCYQAVASRDRRFEGRFVVAVTSTHVYCRPGCPAPIPRRKNTRFFPCAAAAEEAGFRACMRCRPDASPGSPAWLGTSATVARALALIFDGQLDEGGVDALAARLGVGARHLRRLFAEQVGASPQAIAGTRRAHFARKLLDESDLPMAEVALCAGYASLRRFNDAIRDTFRKPPGELRRARRMVRAPEEGLVLRLAYKPPFDWAQLSGFLAARAIAGVEVVDANSYRRTIELDGVHGAIEVRAPDSGEDALELRLRLPAARLGRGLLRVVERVGRLFDLRADPLAIGARLGGDPRLRRLVEARPGLRVPGAWDPFEVMVRAVLGQQISVARASALAAQLVERFGTRVAVGEGLTHLFPSPAMVADADVRSLGMPNARAEAIRGLARAMRDGALALDGDDRQAQLLALPGIGPWTAAYVAMRAFDEPDAFPASDLGLAHAWARLGAQAGPLETAAEAWRPFRAYAAMHLWCSMKPATVTKEME